jgi:hypothetical protein
VLYLCIGFAALSRGANVESDTGTSVSDAPSVQPVPVTASVEAFT